MELTGRRSRGRPRRRFMDAVKEDMESFGVRKEDAEERDRWRQMIGCGSEGNSRKKKKKKKKKTGKKNETIRQNTET